MFVFPVEIGYGGFLKNSAASLPILWSVVIRGKVSVLLCRVFIVIACADLRYIFDPVLSFPGYQAYFGMDLIEIKTVSYIASGIFQAFRPVDVILLVESGSEFHEHGHILPFSAASQRYSTSLV